MQLPHLWETWLPKVEEYWETAQGRKEVTHNFPYQLDEVRIRPTGG
jgi:hypothetical protein